LKVNEILTRKKERKEGNLKQKKVKMKNLTKRK